MIYKTHNVAVIVTLRCAVKTQVPAMGHLFLGSS